MKVFFDGACPLCQREIGFYRRRGGAHQIEWIDLSVDPENALPPGLSIEAARGRFHVLTTRGTLVSGGQAFAELWSELPTFSLAGRVFKTQPFLWLINRAYEVFLPLRPFIQRSVGGGPSND